MDERRHSLANPERCSKFCFVPRELPLLERNLSEADSSECVQAKESTTGEPVEETSSSSKCADGTQRSVPSITVTAEDGATTYDSVGKQNNKHKLTLNLDVLHCSNCDPSPPGDRGWLAPVDPSTRLGQQSQGSVGDDEHSGKASKTTDSSDHLDYLKSITERLQLKTKRPSYIVWKQKYIDDSSEGDHTAKAPTINNCKEKEASRGWTAERTTAIDTALDWLRTSLLEMREQDHALARRLVELRRDIQELKLQRSYEEHQDILDEAIDMIDARDELFDRPPDAFSPTLKHCGVTKMNLSTRRFSVF